MTLQKIPLELVAGDDRAFVVRVEKDGEPFDLSNADLRAQMSAALGQRVTLEAIGGVGRIVVVFDHAATENAVWRQATGDVRLVSDEGVATLFALSIKLLPRVTQIDAGATLKMAETEAATVRIEEGESEATLAETDAGVTVQLDDTLRIVYEAQDNSAVLSRLAALEAQTETVTAAAAEMVGLSGELAEMKVQLGQISVIESRLDEMVQTVSDGLLLQAQIEPLKQQLEALQTAVEDKAAAADIVRLAGQIAAAQTGIDELSEAAAMAGDVVDLGNQITALQAQVSADTAALAALTEKVNDGAALAQVAAEVATLTGKVDAATQATAEIVVLREAIEQLRAESDKADDAVVTALAGRLAALETQVAGMPKYKEYQAGYIPRADFVGTLANNGLITANYPKPFSERPILNVTLDIADAAVRVQYVNNATATGFQVATSYAASMNGVWYEAFIPA